jgi:hypothetical protein
MMIFGQNMELPAIVMHCAQDMCNRPRLGHLSLGMINLTDIYYWVIFKTKFAGYSNV